MNVNLALNLNECIPRNIMNDVKLTIKHSKSSLIIELHPFGM
jgi:hypothetical protein